MTDRDAAADGVTSTADDPIEDYLDRLYARLPADAPGARRLLAEAEDHLRDATDAGVAEGLPLAEARRRAVERIGGVGAFARAATGGPWRLPSAAAIRELALAAVRMVGTGLVAVGVSGGIAAALNAAVGRHFVGGGSGAAYRAGACAHFLSVHPDAGNCVQAAMLETSGDAVSLRVLAGLAGLLVLAVAAAPSLLRRRGDRRATRSHLPTVLVPAVGATAFGGSGAVLLGLALDSSGVRAAGTGFYLSGSVVALAVAAAYALALSRALPPAAR